MDQKDKFIPYDRGNLWTCESGSEKPNLIPILLCSGGPGCCDYLKPVANMLDDEYRVIRFEQRGCGRSTADGQYDLLTAIEDIERVRRFYHIEKWIVGGHSWGANLALVYTMTYPERVQALLYITGTGIHDNRHWSEEFHRNVDEKGEQLPEMDYPFNPEVNDEGNRTLREYGRRTDFYSRISKLSIPALFIIAENDIRPSWPAEQLANLIPNARCIMVKDAAHYLWLDNAEGFRLALSEYLAEIKSTFSVEIRNESKQEIAKQIYESAHLTGTFTLRSGQMSHEYFDKYLFEAKPELLAKIASLMKDIVPQGIEVLAGLEMGGIPVATAISLQTGMSAAFVRKKAKEYGTCKLAEGAEVAGKQVCIVEDVVTTGGAIIDGVIELRKLGALIDTVVCVIQRNSKATDILAEHGLKLIPAFSMDELIEAVSHD